MVRLKRLVGAIRTALTRHAGLMRLLQRIGVVLRDEGWAGVGLRARLLLSAQTHETGLEPSPVLGTVPGGLTLPVPEPVPDWRHIRRPDLPPGAVLVGHPYAVLGRAEDIRTGACAFAAANIPFALRNTFGEYGKEMAVLHRDFPFMDRIDPQATYKANIFFLNANEMEDAFTHLGSDAYAGRYNIGYWAWELSQFPEAWRGAFRDLDEIWAPSRFIQQAVSRQSTLPSGVDAPGSGAGQLGPVVPRVFRPAG